MVPAKQTPDDQPVEYIDVLILDRDFRLAVMPSERPLLEKAVQMVDERMRSLRDSGRIAGMDRIAVMAALQIANELVSMTAASGKDVGAADNLKKIRKLNTHLEAELKRQEDLF
ncbi:MAG: cell division protein ZapA [Burkholderiaceae bacterium]